MFNAQRTLFNESSRLLVQNVKEPEDQYKVLQIHVPLWRFYSAELEVGKKSFLISYTPAFAHTSPRR